MSFKVPDMTFVRTTPWPLILLLTVSFAHAAPESADSKAERLRTFEPSADEVLRAPEGVEGDFDVASEPPIIHFAILPGQTYDANPWSNWGDSHFGPDGRFYGSIGDHLGPYGASFVYSVDPDEGTVEMVVAVNEHIEASEEDYAPGKIHAPLMDGGDGWMYFGTYRGSGGGTRDEHNYEGDWLLRYNYESGEVENLGFPVPKHGMPVTAFDTERRLIYGLTAYGRDADEPRNQFFAYSVDDQETLFFGGPSPDMARTLLLADDGRVFYSAEEVFYQYDPETNELTRTSAAVPGEGGLRAALPRPKADGVSYGISRQGTLFSFDTDSYETEDLGIVFPVGRAYTTSMRMDPSERFIYYIPSAHGGSREHGAAVIQYDIENDRRKVIAFLSEYFKTEENYNLGGTFGIALSDDGGRLFVTWNGGPAGEDRNDFGLCSVMILDIPESER